MDVKITGSEYLGVECGVELQQGGELSEEGGVERNRAWAVESQNGKQPSGCRTGEREILLI